MHRSQASVRQPRSQAHERLHTCNRWVARPGRSGHGRRSGSTTSSRRSKARGAHRVALGTLTGSRNTGTRAAAAVRATYSSASAGGSRVWGRSCARLHLNGGDRAGHQWAQWRRRSSAVGSVRPTAPRQPATARGQQPQPHPRSGLPQPAPWRPAGGPHGPRVRDHTLRDRMLQAAPVLESRKAAVRGCLSTAVRAQAPTCISAGATPASRWGVSSRSTATTSATAAATSPVLHATQPDARARTAPACCRAYEAVGLQAPSQRLCCVLVACGSVRRLADLWLC